MDYTMLRAILWTAADHSLRNTALKCCTDDLNFFYFNFMKLSLEISCNPLMQPTRFITLHASTLRLEAACFSETPLLAYRIPRCHIPEDYNLNTQIRHNILS